MRTKIEKNHKKQGEPKLNINLPTPKVVLNANDCARLLDGMGKTSVLLVEKEGKIVAATSKTASSSSASASSSSSSTSSSSLTVSSSAAASSTSLTAVSSSLSSNLSSTQTVSAAAGTTGNAKLCKSSTSPTSVKSNSAKDISTSSTSCKGNAVTVKPVHNDREAPAETKVILKPPKKRRGLDKKYEDLTPTPAVLNNGDISHAVVSSVQDTLDSGFVTNSCTSPAETSQPKHSVDNMLHPSVAPALTVSNNNKPLISESYPYDSRPHPAEPASASLSTLPLPPSSSSSKLDEYHENGSYHLPLLRTTVPCINQSCDDHNQAGLSSPASQNHAYPSSDHPPSQPLVVLTAPSKPLTNPTSFQQLPEQLEPMNLSTSCKPAVGLVSSEAPVITKISQTAEDVSCAASSHCSVETKKLVTTQLETYESQSEVVPVKVIEKKKQRKKQQKPQSVVPSQIPAPQEKSNAAQSPAPGDVVQGTMVDTAEIDHASSSEVMPGLNSDLSQTVSSKFEPSNVSHEPSDTAELSSPALLHTGGKAAENSGDIKLTDREASTSLSISQSQLSPTVTLTSQHVSQTDTSLTQPDTQITNDQQDTENGKQAPVIGETESNVKLKKSAKKKAEIPMDEISCANRISRYSVTIDDVISNFVYIPEPIEEFSLTEEEEAAIRDQFEDVHDTGSHEVHESGKTAQAVATKKQVIPQPSETAEVSKNLAENELPKNSAKPPKKRQPLVPKDPQPEAQPQDPQKREENIDSVLALVASGASNTVKEGESGKKVKKVVKKPKPTGTSESTVEGAKKKKVVKKDVPSSAEGEIAQDQVSQSTGNPDQSESQGTGNPDMAAGSEGDKVKTEKLASATKLSKPKKAKKRKADKEEGKSADQLVSEADKAQGKPQSEGEVPKKKKKSVTKPKTQSKQKAESKKTSISSDAHTQSSLGPDKETAGSNKAETSDIGESIASTSGGSEQDTPVHELESKDEVGSAEPQPGDKENHDTGVESASEDNKPVRRYKKRLDFVKCDQCEHQARGRSALSRHMKKVHMLEVNMPHKCQYCDYGCTKMASLNRHLFTHGVFPCSRCTFVTDERAKLTQHVMDEHKDKLDMKLCKVCNRYIKCENITIEQHTEECQGPTPFKCSQCEKEFKYASSLRVHYHTHFPDQPKRFKCEQCDYRTNYKANLHKHHKNMHASRDRDVQCPDCGKLFSTEDNMRRHRKVHTLVRPFACETCKKTFKTSGALKGHQLIHTATRPFSCNIPGCNRSFRTPKFLKSHQEEYHRLVPKKFFCSVEGCNYSFFKRSHLKRHAITHTGERNYHCTWPGCSKSFRHADNLKVHFRSHTNEKPVQCHLCDFKCKQKNSLFWHKKKVHQIIDISVCPKRMEQKLKREENASKDKSEGSEKEGKSDLASEESSPAALAASAVQTQTESDVATETVKDSVAVESEDHTDMAAKAVVDHKGEAAKPATPSEHSMGTQTPLAEEQGPLDLYEFKSDEESEEETPGNFRRDKAVVQTLPPLPPPPKELLRKNEMQEMKEKEKKEKAEKREQERKEKAEKKEQEKKEKIEKREQEKKEKLEKKEQEKREKAEKKEQEKKEKAEKKEQEKKEKLEKKLEKKLALKKAVKKKDKDVKEKNKTENKEGKKKSSKSPTAAGKEGGDKTSIAKSPKAKDNAEKGPAKSPSNSLKRKRPATPAPKEKDEPKVEEKKLKRGRKKKYIGNNADDPSKQKEQKEGAAAKAPEEKDGAPPAKKSKMSTRKGKMQEEPSSVVATSPRAATSKPSPPKKNPATRGKKKGKLTPPKRKPSARIKARKKAKAGAGKSKAATKSQKSPKPGPKKKVGRKKSINKAKEGVEPAGKTVDDDKGTDTGQQKIETEELAEKQEEEQKVPEKSSQEEVTLLPHRPLSPGYSEEIMLQGKASPYRDFSDAENLEENESEIEQKEDRVPEQDGEEESQSPDSREEAEESLQLEQDSQHVDTSENFASDKQVPQPTEESSDDEVSNDIPLTPPRAPAPPPVESSEDEMEPEPEPTPISVPGPNTPFSVPGPNTPFSVPPPTNLMQQHSVHSEDAPLSAVPSIPSMEMHSQGSVEMQQPLGSVEMHSHGSVEMNHSHGSVDMHHPQGSVEMAHPHGSVEMHPHNTSGEMHPHGSVDMRPHGSVEFHSQGSVEMAQPHGTIEMQNSHGSIPESMTSNEQLMPSVRTPESNMRDNSSHSMSGKYSLHQPLPDQSQEADKEYFDQYLKSLSAANNQAANGGLEPSPSGLQQLEAMVGKTHQDARAVGNKSPISSLPTSVITSLESTLPILPSGDLRVRMDALVSEKHPESLYARDTASALPRLTDRQSATPLPPNMAAAPPAFDTFSPLNSLHPAAASSRENYLRQPENLFPTPPVTSSFMAEAMFQRQAMTTPFLPPQPTDRSSLSRIPDTTPLRSSSSSSLLRRTGAMPGSDMFASPTMPQTMPRHPFANPWASQEVRPTHWQNPYLPRQPNMTPTGTFFPTKDNYLTGREFMFDPSVRPSTERGMFPSLSSSQTQDSFPLDRFDLSNYFPNAMTPYASSTGSLDYSRSAHTAATKPFDERYRQTAAAASATIPDFRSLPPTTASTDMFSGLPGVNPSFNLYSNPMSYHTQHMTDNVNSAFLTHSSSAQHAMFERDYAAAAAHRGLYPQNTPYPFIDERQYPGAAKLGTHPVAPTPAPQERDLMSRSSVSDSQVQDPYRSIMYRY